MILQALVDYYEALAGEGKISRLGWGKTRVQYALEIDERGALIVVLPLESINEKGKPIPRYFDLPAPVKRTVGIDANFLWDNAAYLLGIDGKGKPERAVKCFEAAKDLHLSLLSGLDDPFAKAICAFFETWSPGAAAGHTALTGLRDVLDAGANLTFYFRDDFPGDAPVLARVWQSHYDGEDKDTATMRCLVTGEPTVPEAIHPSIKRVRGAQSSGAALVSFNAPAFWSYGQEQNLNAPVGKYAAFAYTTALNQLIADSEHVRLIGDTTVVFWAENAQVQYQDAFGCFLDGDSEDVMTDGDLKGVMDALATGRPVVWDDMPLKPDNRFFVLGLAPNAARLSVRFFLRDSFGDFTRRMNEHYERLRIVRPEYDRFEHLPLWKLLGETVNQNARNKSASPQMAGDTLRSILTGARYPATLYLQTQLRIKAENNVTRGRAAIIKAYLLRNVDLPFNKEELTVELNEKTTYQPYVLGRMFAVLENIQEAANPDINTTIGDKYFTAACATPKSVFPTLIDLAKKHLKKLRGTNTGAYFKLGGQLKTLFDMIKKSYPAHHTLSDQGIFQIGYYHQTQKRYEKKENKEDK